MDTMAAARLEGTALEAWRSYLQSHAAILRALDAELVADQGMTTRDYEVLLYLAQAPERRLAMSALAESTMLTRSGITRLVDGLVGAGLIERVSCPSDARASYAQLTEDRVRQASEAGAPTSPASAGCSSTTSGGGDPAAGCVAQPTSRGAATAPVRSSDAAGLRAGPTGSGPRGHRRYPWQPRRRGGVATQRPAKPSTPVRFRSSPLNQLPAGVRVWLMYSNRRSWTRTESVPLPLVRTLVGGRGRRLECSTSP